MDDVADTFSLSPGQQAELERKTTLIAAAGERRRQESQASPPQGETSLVAEFVWGAVETIGDVVLATIDAAGSAASCAGEAACATGGAFAEGAAALVGGIASTLSEL